MKTIFNGIFLALIPFLMTIAFVVMLVFGLVVAFYLFFWGIIIGAALFVIAFFYRLLFGGKGFKTTRANKKQKEPKKEPHQKEGRTFDYKDIK